VHSLRNAQRGEDQAYLRTIPSSELLCPAAVIAQACSKLSPGQSDMASMTLLIAYSPARWLSMPIAQYLNLTSSAQNLLHKTHKLFLCAGVLQQSSRLVGGIIKARIVEQSLYGLANLINASLFTAHYLTDARC